MGGYMKVKTEKKGDVGIIYTKGKMLGAPESDELYDEVRLLLHDGIRKIVIDLHGITFMNSMGVGSLMRSYTTVSNKEGKVVISRMSEKAERLFLITQIIKVFKVYDNIDEAVNSF